MATYFAHHLDHGQLTNHDRPLGFHWNVPGLAQDLGLCAPRKLEAAVSSVLAEAILGAESGMAVSYSRNRNFYANSQRYRGTAYTYVTVLSAIALLYHTGWIINRKVPPRHLGWQSSFVATTRLMEAWYRIATPITYVAGEIIFLKNAAGELVDYVETRNTRRLRRDLAQCNACLSHLAIQIPGAERRGQHIFIDRCYILPTPGNPLRRIFSRSSFSLHGRAYGWWQSIPKKARASLTINGEPVAEADYRSLHASILYSQAGIPFSGDAYDIDGFERAEVKRCFNIAINAKTKAAAVAATAHHLGKSRHHCAQLVQAIQHRHKPIQHQFCSDAGVRLMRIDSELILSALEGMQDAGDPALPIHDALIVPARCALKARDLMVEAFERIVGRVSPCTVNIKQQSVLQMGERHPGLGFGVCGAAQAAVPVAYDSQNRSSVSCD